MKKKISSFLCHFGIDDLGHVCLLEHPKAFFEDLMKEGLNCGYDLYTRNALFTKSFFTSKDAPFINKFLEGQTSLNSISSPQP